VAYISFPYTRSIWKNVGPIRHNEPPHASSPDVASGTVARRLRIDVHNDDNAWQRGPLRPHGMGPITVDDTVVVVLYIIIIIIIKHIYRAHFRRMPQMRWRQQLHVK